MVGYFCSQFGLKDDRLLWITFWYLPWIRLSQVAGTSLVRRFIPGIHTYMHFGLYVVPLLRLVVDCCTSIGMCLVRWSAEVHLVRIHVVSIYIYILRSIYLQLSDSR